MINRFIRLINRLNQLIDKEFAPMINYCINVWLIIRADKIYELFELYNLFNKREMFFLLVFANCFGYIFVHDIINAFVILKFTFIFTFPFSSLLFFAN